jgi:DNA-binding IclR family transcriptional regulator
MFFSTGLDHVDPALLAFVKCHVTSPLKWETLRVLAAQDGTWFNLEALARAVHKSPPELTSALRELLSEGVVEECPEGYRLPPHEPTSVVLRRLIETATHSQELRSIIVANLQQSRLRTSISPSPAAA